MKKTYQKPTLNKAGALSTETAILVGKSAN
jgi:hypothetical protein